MIFDIKKLKELRKSLNLTQTQFARKANVSQSLIAKIEAGKIDPTYSKVQSIMEAINKLSYEHETEAKEIMITKIIAAKPEDKVTGIIRKLHKYAISQLPVVEDEKIIGMVYEHNILEEIAKRDIKELKAEDIMSETPPTISTVTKLSVITNLLKHYPIILVTEKSKLVGVICKSDILKKLI